MLKYFIIFNTLIKSFSTHQGSSLPYFPLPTSQWHQRMLLLPTHSHTTLTHNVWVLLKSLTILFRQPSFLLQCLFYFKDSYLAFILHIPCRLLYRQLHIYYICNIHIIYIYIYNTYIHTFQSPLSITVSFLPPILGSLFCIICLIRVYCLDGSLWVIQSLNLHTLTQSFLFPKGWIISRLHTGLFGVETSSLISRCFLHHHQSCSITNENSLFCCCCFDFILLFRSL